MADEFENKNASESNPQVENKVVKENVFVHENKPVLENKEASETLDTVGKAKAKKTLSQKKKRNYATLSAGLVGAVSLALVGITSLVNVKMKAELDKDLTKYVDGKIQYKVDVKNMTEKETLSIYLKQDNEVPKKIDLFDQDGDGVIEGALDLDHTYIDEKLSSGENVSITYTLELKGNVGLNIERLFGRQIVTIDKKTSKFHGFDWHCECGKDGYFYFTVNVEDYNHIFSNWSAWIEDDFGHSFMCKTLNDENIYEEQKIYVLEDDEGHRSEGSHGALYIKYKADDGVENGQGDKDAEGFYIQKTDIYM